MGCDSDGSMSHSAYDAAAGSVKKKRLPWPSSLSTPTCPPNFSTMLCTIGRPSPFPDRLSWLSELPRLNKQVRASGGIPGPLSRVQKRSVPSVLGEAPSSTRGGRPPYLSALLRKFAQTSSIQGS